MRKKTLRKGSGYQDGPVDLNAGMEVTGEDKLKTWQQTYSGTGHGIRVMLYSHDTLGLGHLQRNLKIIRALKARYPELTILLATGSLRAHSYEFPAGVDYLKLPAVRKAGDEKYEPRFPGTSFEQTLKLRTILLLETVKNFSPDIVLVDHAPLGMKTEMLPALEWLRKSKCPSITVLGMRDILDEPQKVIRLWKKLGVYDVLRSLYDRILVYGSPVVFDPLTSYRFPADIKAKTSYCGYITEPYDNRNRSRVTKARSKGDRKFVLVTIGGGEWQGETIIGSFLELLREHQSSIEFDSLILTGPFLPDHLWRRFRQAARNLPTRLLRFVPHIRPFLTRSDLVISTVGYNTITDIMSYARKALVIPRIKWRKEQLIRAEKLSSLGLLSFMHPGEVTSDRLYGSITDLLGSDDAPLASARSRQLLDLNGAQRMAEYVGELLARIEKTKEATL